MSKRRTRHRSLSSVLDKQPNALSFNKKTNFAATNASSFYVPIKKSRTLSIDMTEFNKDKTFNKNICFFRNTFNQNDSTQLPFMSSLRIKKKSFHNHNKLTQPHPFQVQMKSTMNQQSKKQIFDINGKKSRISTAYYRWHKNSGQNTTQCTEFECSLRDYGSIFNPEQLGFTNIIQPIRHKKCEPKIYQASQLICPKQKKCFNLQ